MADPKTNKLHGVPLNLIEEAAKNYEKVLVYISRRGADGRVRSIGNVTMDTVKLADIESYLRDLGGGGTYSIRVARTDNHLVAPEPLKNFDVSVEGAPKPVTARENGLDYSAGISATMPVLGGTPDMSAIPVSMYRQLTPEEQARIPAYMRHLPLDQLHSFLANQRPHHIDPAMPPPPQYAPLPQAKFASDELAARQTEHYREELLAINRKLDEREKQWAKEREELNKRLDDERQARRDEAHKGEIAAMNARLEALMQRPVEPPKPAFNLAEWTPLIVGLVPVLQAVVSSGNAARIAQAEQQQKAFEIQMNGMTSLMKAQPAPKDSNKELFDGLVKLAPIFAPAVVKLIENKSPEAQANMWATNAENQLTMIQMIAQMTQELASSSGQEPAWMPVVQQLIGVAMKGVESMVSGQKSANPLAPQQGEKALPQGTVETPHAEFTQGQQVAKMIFAHPQFPKELQTQEWFDIIGALHDNEDPKLVAKVLADHVIGLENDEKIPDFLKADWEADPKQVLLNILGSLPVGQQNPEYVTIVVDNVIELYEAAGPDEEVEEQEVKKPEPKKPAQKQPTAP